MLIDVITYLKPTAAFDQPNIIMITTGDEKTMPQPEDVQVPELQVAVENTQAQHQPQFPPDIKRPQEGQAHPPPYTDFAAGTSTPPSNMSEAEWKAKLRKLEGKIRKYNWTKRGDETAIVESMRDLAASHSDPQVQAYWTRRANEFETAPESDKKALLKDIGRGLAILVAAPFAIAGAVLVGTGMLLKAGGNILTGQSTKLLK
ncbi:6PF2K domain-containing protein [Mycena sanguinolenta]|uniref:6PF2K domain-containing protein n=1 Tax=Mycena sanguinolenta TaxID=230812 RepID=A0A8H7CY38_9AGAR|nr:6PF2K domain-containing protein [Mycena sanguinolenta]